MNRIALLAVSFFAGACLEADHLDTGMDELESSMEVHEVDLAERKGAATSYSLSTATTSDGTLVVVTSASSSCGGLKKVSSACCALAKAVLAGDTTSATCTSLTSTCPSIGYRSHNPTVWDAQMACLGWDDDSTDGEIIGTP